MASSVSLLFLFLVFNSAQAGLEPLNIQGLTFEPIHGFGSYTTENLLGQPSLWILFQPQCAICEMQLKSLQCFPSTLKKVAVGHWGRKEAFEKILRKTSFQGEALLASESWIQKIGIRQTPSILIVNGKGNVVERVDFYVPCEQLRKKMKQKELI